MIGHYYTQRLKHALRFRTKRGYGVHSPYMFALIMHVLREKNDNIYTYPTIKDLKRRKDRRLLRLTFRIITHLCPTDIYSDGNRKHILDNYFTNITIHHNLKDLDKVSLIWLDSNSLRTLKHYNKIYKWATETKEHHSIMIMDINKNANQLQLWNSLSGVATVKVEMMWYGLLIFDKKLQPGNYHLIP